MPCTVSTMTDGKVNASPKALDLEQTEPEVSVGDNWRRKVLIRNKGICMRCTRADVLQPWCQRPWQSTYSRNE